MLRVAGIVGPCVAFLQSYNPQESVDKLNIIFAVRIALLLVITAAPAGMLKTFRSVRFSAVKFV